MFSCTSPAKPVTLVRSVPTVDGTSSSGMRVWDSAANFIYVQLRHDLTGANPEQTLATLVKKMKARGTLIRHTGGGLRITVGTPEENERTLIRLKDVLG